MSDLTALEWTPALVEWNGLSQHADCSLSVRTFSAMYCRPYR